ncbi:MAG: GNAT family N-acetyltransferase [Tepidisphaeraceae bacterium]
MQTFQIRPAERREIHAALQMILGVNGRSAAEEHVVDFLRFAVYRGIDLTDTWVAVAGGQLLWAVLPVVSPGRTMLLFSPSHVPSTLIDTCAAALIERTLEHSRGRAVDLAQVLLDPADEAAAQTYQSCGFVPLAELIYLEREVHRASIVPLPPTFTWETYSDANHADFARTVMATYAGSLDCPRLNGRRGIEDVLAGHKAAGEFDPKLWFLLHEVKTATAGDRNTGDRSAGTGVLLMSRSTRSDAVELVYLGLTPEQRGKHLGDAMMRHAVASAAAIGSRRLSLAVDSNNAPALRLYRRHGMTHLCSRLALLRDLRG